jgi:hypothetical protein
MRVVDHLGQGFIDEGYSTLFSTPNLPSKKIAIFSENLAKRLERFREE